jgi:GTP-binding protein LepA
VSARQGTGVDELFDAIVSRIPAPTGKRDAPLRALIFDCHYDPYRGVIVHIRLSDGALKRGMKIRFMYNDSEYDVETVG